MRSHERNTIRRFYAYLLERERIRLRKEAGLPWPWTKDAILRDFKFTNVRRSDDRTTQFLVDNFYRKPGHTTSSPAVCLMNCAIFRYHGTSEFAEAVGWSTKFPGALARIEQTARGRLISGQRVFTGAYMITNMKIKGPKEGVVRMFMENLWDRAESLVQLAEQERSWEIVSSEMRKIKGFGGSGFMVKEILLDAMFTNFWWTGRPDDADTWTPIGPGANRGLERIFYPEEGRPLGRINEVIAGEHLRQVHAEQRKYWPKLLKFSNKFPAWRQSPLSMHDVQFGMCEFDKYERTRLGQGRPRSRYRRKS